MPDILQARRILILIILTFVIAFMLGGSATYLNQSAQLVMLALSCAVLAWIMRFPQDQHAPIPLTAQALIWAILAWPAIQLIPLPPFIWTALPGRDLVRAILHHVGGQDQWMPISLRPLDTMRSLLTLLPAVVLFSGIARLPLRMIDPLLWAIVAMIGLSCIIGIVQVSSGGAMFAILPSTHRGYALGFFSNRNHHADAIIFAYLLSSYFAARVKGEMARSGAQLAIAISAVALVMATGSRTGMVLLLLAMLLVLILSLAGHWRSSNMRPILLFILVVAAAMIAMLWSSPGRRLLARYGDLGWDDRAGYLQVAWPLVDQYWTTGSGFGSFAALYATVEPITSLRASYVNAAHNDYYQLLIEGGMTAIILLGAFFAMLIAMVHRLSGVKEQSSPSVRLAWLMLGYVALILAHSAVDYPLRTVSMQCIMAIAAGLAFRMTGLATEGGRKAQP